MSPSIRRATPKDLAEMVGLLIGDAEHRRSLDPVLWRVAADAVARIEGAIRPALDGSEAAARELWLLAEASDRIVGIAHAMMLPVPPIYGGAAGHVPGLVLDDCFTAADAPPGSAENLLAAIEAELRAMGASRLIASCPAAGPWRRLYEREGYEPVTLYMTKHGFTPGTLPPGVRAARSEDVPGIVSLSADHRRMLARLNPRFWHIHPDADSRFERWMRHSLTLADRDMAVAGPPDEVHGYVIAQPIAPLLVPAAHDIGPIGVIDDFYSRDFADSSTMSNNGTTAASLLSTAESAFARRGFAAALVVCPSAWSSKVALLEREGYRTAKLWMLKR
jgi:GNAT superfamily N-acetyltransferase